MVTFLDFALFMRLMRRFVMLSVCITSVDPVADADLSAAPTCCRYTQTFTQLSVYRPAVRRVRKMGPARFCAKWISMADVITGSIARSANLPVFSLLRGRRYPPPCQISLPSVQRQGCRTPKIEIFTQI